MTASARGTTEKPGRKVRAKAGLNKAILEQGWYQFAELLSYKIEERGGVLASVPAAYTSQTCAECGSICKHHRKSQAVFHCLDCGHSAHADTNAAINILRAGTRPAVSGPPAPSMIRESRSPAPVASTGKIFVGNDMEDVKQPPRRAKSNKTPEEWRASTNG